MCTSSRSCTHTQTHTNNSWQRHCDVWRSTSWSVLNSTVCGQERHISWERGCKDEGHWSRVMSEAVISNTALHRPCVCVWRAGLCRTFRIYIRTWTVCTKVLEVPQRGRRDVPAQQNDPFAKKFCVIVCCVVPDLWIAAHRFNRFSVWQCRNRFRRSGLGMGTLSSRVASCQATVLNKWQNNGWDWDSRYIQTLQVAPCDNLAGRMWADSNFSVSLLILPVDDLFKLFDAAGLWFSLRRTKGCDFSTRSRALLR